MYKHLLGESGWDRDAVGVRKKDVAPMTGAEGGVMFYLAAQEQTLAQRLILFGLYSALKKKE